MRSVTKGFTLAELLIALAILGVIATFTIPKIIVAQQNQSYNATAKEAAATIAVAYERLKLNGTLTTNTVPGDIIPFLNYTQVVNPASFIDPAPNTGGAPLTCGSPCYRLHNGGILRIGACSFNGSTSLNKISYNFDPDGQQTGQQDSIYFNLYYNGRITTFGHAPAGSTSSCAAPSGAPDPAQDPSWFSW